jgi:hypothetical protein
MARPRKSQSAENQSATQSNELEINQVVEQKQSPFTENEQLRKEIEELKKAMALLLSNKENVIAEKDKEAVLDEVEDLDEYNNIKIAQDDYVKVICLVDHEVNLTTKPYGRGGKVFTFRKKYEVKRILYSDLVEILENHPTFIEAGYVYLADKKVIRKHGLDEVYKNILSQDKIEQIMAGNSSNDSVTLFKSANPKQQEVIVEMLIKKLSDNPDSVDLNMVDKISRASGVKIQEKAEEAREYAEMNNKKQ